LTSNWRCTHPPHQHRRRHGNNATTISSPSAAVTRPKREAAENHRLLRRMQHRLMRETLYRPVLSLTLRRHDLDLL